MTIGTGVELPSEFWRCCGENVNSRFCPRCGHEKPKPVHERGGQLRNHFDYEAKRAQKSSETYFMKAGQLKERINKGEHVDDGYGGNLLREQWHRAIGSGKALRKRSETFFAWRDVVDDLISRIGPA